MIRIKKQDALRLAAKVRASYDDPDVVELCSQVILLACEAHDLRKEKLGLVLMDSAYDLDDRHWECQYCHQPTEVGSRWCAKCERTVRRWDDETRQMWG